MNDQEYQEASDEAHAKNTSNRLKAPAEYSGKRIHEITVKLFIPLDAHDSWMFPINEGARNGLAD